MESHDGSLQVGLWRESVVIALYARWVLALFAVVTVAVVIVCLVSAARRKQWQATLLRNSELAQADAMTGPQFEKYFADLLKLRGHHSVMVVGGAGDGGIDILATAPDGRQMAYQCKRQVAKVGVQVVRQLNGSVTFEHHGRLPCLVTTAVLTKPAADLARKSGVQVVNRPTLGRLMAEARVLLSPPVPTGPAPGTLPAAPASKPTSQQAPTTADPKSGSRPQIQLPSIRPGSASASRRP